MKIFKLFCSSVIACLFIASVKVSAETPLFTVTPKQITSGTTFTIHLPLPRPTQFAVKRPDGTWVYIVNEEPKFSSQKFENFTKSNLITVNVSEFKGKSFNENGDWYNAVVFTKSGKYMFYIATNIDTEPENTDSLETYVEYVNSEIKK